MVNINAGNEGAMDFIVASQIAGRTWLKSLEDKVNDALKEFNIKTLFFRHYDHTLWVVPVPVETDKRVFLTSYFKKLTGIKIEREEDVIKALSDWYIYLEPSQNLVTIKGTISPESEVAKKVFETDGLRVREEYNEDG